MLVLCTLELWVDKKVRLEMQNRRKRANQRQYSLPASVAVDMQRIAAGTLAHCLARVLRASIVIMCSDTKKKLK